ncbi:MAG: copper amine oxidase N-terminal domain-containing protein [Clostridiales Family XIII bacterium]|nr:copper amine oxidase N-terminal domain-containing protein [Clostridiales Family XIII bacterium]
MPDGILYLEDRTYVPLRLFAESMGAEVTWTPPAETGTGRGRVDIY